MGSTRFKLVRDAGLAAIAAAKDLINDAPTVPVIAKVFRQGEDVKPPDTGGTYAKVTFGAEKLATRGVGLEQVVRETTAAGAGGKQTLVLPWAAEINFVLPPVPGETSAQKAARAADTHANLLGNVIMAVHRDSDLNGGKAISSSYTGGGTELLTPDEATAPSRWTFTAEFTTTYQQRRNDPRTS